MDARAMLVYACQEAHKKANLMVEQAVNAGLTGEELMLYITGQEIAEARFLEPVNVAITLMQANRLTIEQVKDAAWEGYNGLLEATTLTANVQHRLGIPVNELDIGDFTMERHATGIKPFIRFAKTDQMPNIVWEDFDLLDADQQAFANSIRGQLRKQAIEHKATLAVVYWRNPEDFCGITIPAPDPKEARAKFQALYNGAVDPN